MDSIHLCLEAKIEVMKKIIEIQFSIPIQIEELGENKVRRLKKCTFSTRKISLDDVTIISYSTLHLKRVLLT